MNRKRVQYTRSVISIVAGYLLHVCTCTAQDNVSRMEEVCQWYTGSKQFMGSVLVARNDQVLFD
jgi:hypothetical protein